MIRVNPALVRIAVGLFLLLGQGAVAQAPSATTGQAPAPSPSSSPAGAAQSLPAFKVTTRLVVLDVVVTDHKGVPLKDLGIDDFRIEEEKQPQKIRVFGFQDAQQQAAAAPPNVPPGRITNLPRFKTSGPLNVILLDGLNTNSKNLIYAKDEMLRMLEKLPAGQPVAIYVLGSRLRLLQDFTTDPSLLKEAVHSLKGKAAPKIDASTAQSEPFLTPDIASAMNEMGMQGMVQQILAFEQENVTYQTDYRVELTLTALKALARNLSGYPGRKNLIWVSDVFPTYIFPQDNGTSNRGSVAQQARDLQRDYSQEIQLVSDALANSHIAVYPVEARAVGSSDAYSNLSNSDSQGNYLGRSATGRGTGRISQGDELSRSVNDSLDAHSTMNTLAEETGGRAFYNTNDFSGVMRESMRDGSVYYTIGYYPENKTWDGKFRRIAVKVDRPGAKLRFRQGYYASDPQGYSHLNDKQRTADFGRALGLDVPVSTALQFQAVTIPPSAKDAKVHINFGVDAHGLAFDLADDGLHHASVDCAVQVYSKKREPIHIQGNTFSVALKPEQYQMVMEKFFPCNQALDLPAGDYVLRLGVRDNRTGLIGTANATLTVPASAAAATGAAPAASEERKP